MDPKDHLIQRAPHPPTGGPELETPQRLLLRLHLLPHGVTVEDGPCAAVWPTLGRGHQDILAGLDSRLPHRVPHMGTSHTCLSHSDMLM